MKLFFTYIRRILIMSFKKQTTYKTDFFAAIINSTMWFIMQGAYIALLFHSNLGGTIGGANQNTMLFILFMSQIVLMFMFAIIIHPLKMIFDQMNNGGLDVHFLKPINSSLAILVQEIGLRTSVIIIFYLIPFFPLFYFIGGFQISLLQLFSIGVILSTSIVLLYSLYVFSLSLNFYFPNLYASNTILFNIGDISRYPKSVYPQNMQLVLTYMLPLFLVTNPIYNVFLGDFSLTFFLWYLPLVFLFVALSWTSWIIGVRKYSSAG